MVESSDLSKKTNRFFFNPFTPKKDKEYIATRLQDDNIFSATEEQINIFRMRYIDGKPVNFIADLTGYSPSKIKQELATIRAMLDKLNIL